MTQPRHYFPSFAMLHQRVTARPELGYDVMRTADSWLAAMLTDTMIHCEAQAGRIVNQKTPSHWYVIYGKISRDLNSWVWRACINHYLPKHTN